MNDKLKGFFALLASAFIYSTFGVAIRQLSLMFGTFSQIAVKSVIAVLVVLILWFFKEYTLKIPKEKRWQVLAFAIVFPISILFFTFSVLTTKVNNSVFTLYITSIATSFVMGVWIFKEKVTFQKIAAIILVFIGLLFLVYPFEFNLISIGIVFGLIGGVLDGISNTLRKFVSGVNRQTLLFYQFSFAALMAFILATFTQETMLIKFEWIPLIFGIASGIAWILIGNLTIFGFKKVDVNIGTVVLATELMFAVVINFIFLNEVPTQTELMGGIIIFIAACLVGLDLSRLKKQKV